MDSQLVKPFLVATHRVFSKMLNTSIRAGRPRAVASLPPGDTTATSLVVIGDSSAGLLLLLCLPAETARRAADALSDGPAAPESGTTVVEDITRWVTSAVRRETLGGHHALASLRVVTGDEAGALIQGVRSWVSIPFDSALGGFTVAIGQAAARVIPPTHASA